MPADRDLDDPPRLPVEPDAGRAMQPFTGEPPRDDGVAESVSRRRLLRAGLALGGTGMATVLDGPHAMTRAVAAPHVPPARTPLHLFGQDDLDFQVSFALGEVAYGAGEAGEVVSAVDAARAAGASYQSVFDAFMALGTRLAVEAQAAQTAGRTHTARARHLRSASCFNQALYFVLGTRTPAAEPSIYRAMQQQWAAFAALSQPAFARVEIPYRNGISLPAYVLRPVDDGRRRRTVIINNGSDAQFVDLFAYGVAAAAERGYNVLVFEGPGQGSLLFEHGICVTPDWPGVITPIVDYLLDRGDVDPDRIALTGWSMGGNLVMRAAAQEHRLAAVVADPGAVDLLAPYLAHGGADIFAADPPARDRAWRDYVSSPLFTSAQKFLFAKRLELFAPSLLEAARAGRVLTDVGAFVEAVSAFTIPPEMAANIRAHVLVTDYEHEQFFAGQAEQLMGLLTSAASKTLLRFTAAEGAAFHCAPLAPRVRNEAVFDWLDATLA